MKSQITVSLNRLFKTILFVLLIFVLAHIIFLFMVLFNYKVPEYAEVKYVNCPVEIFWTRTDTHLGRKTKDGSLIEFQKSPIDFILHNIKDSTKLLQVTTMTGKLTLDVSNNKEILLILFLKRISFFLVFFFITLQFQYIFSTFQKNEPFNPKNYRRVKIVAFLVMVLSPLVLLFNELSIYVFKDFKIDVHSFIRTHNLNLQFIFLGLMILIIAFVFETGSKLQQESELTI
jgi:hypothetical protein